MPMQWEKALCLSSQVQVAVHFEMLCLCLPRQIVQMDRMRLTSSSIWCCFWEWKEHIFFDTWEEPLQEGGKQALLSANRTDMWWACTWFAHFGESVHGWFCGVCVEWTIGRVMTDVYGGFQWTQDRGRIWRIPVTQGGGRMWNIPVDAGYWHIWRNPVDTGIRGFQWTCKHGYEWSTFGMAQWTWRCNELALRAEKAGVMMRRASPRDKEEMTLTNELVLFIVCFDQKAVMSVVEDLFVDDGEVEC